MISRKELARIVSDRFAGRGGKRIPLYLADWMIGYIFEAIKIALVEDGCVKIRDYMTIERVDVPEHKKMMPNGEWGIVPFKSRVRVKFSDAFVDDVNNGEYKEHIEKRHDDFG